jgi:hypothetical protein
VVFACGFGNDISFDRVVPVGILSTQSGRPHGLQYGQESTYYSEWLNGVDIEEDITSRFIDGCDIDRFDGEGLIGIGEGCGFWSYVNGAYDIFTRNRAGRVGHKERELKAAEEFKRISPGFKSTALIAQNSESPPCFDERCSGLSEPMEDQFIGFDRKFYDQTLLG